MHPLRLLTSQRLNQPMHRFALAKSAMLIVLASTIISHAHGQEEATGRDPKEFKTENSERKPVTELGYREMDFRGLTIKVLPGETGSETRDNAFLRVNTMEALAAFNRSMRLGAKLKAGADALPLPFVESLKGYPGLLTWMDKDAPRVFRFTLSKPARVYALLGWQNAPAAGDSTGWQRYEVDPTMASSVYFKDFPAGANEIKVQPGFFAGVGIVPLDGLSEHEKIVAVFSESGGKASLRILNFHNAEQTLNIRYSWRDPNAKGSATPKETVATLKPGENFVPVPIEGQKDGVTYWLEASLSGSGSSWKISAPYGSYPPQATNASVEAPIIPYGAYMKVEANDDPMIYDQLLRATFWHMRELSMNTVVLSTEDAPKAHLNLAKTYGLKVIVRLFKAGGPAQEEMMKHPAILTYMVGDEPKIGPKLDQHIAMLEGLTKKYPDFKAVTCTIFDAWGTGGEADPDRIYNDHLQNFNLVRLGRLYSLQKLDYGVGKPISYKCRQDATSVMLGLEADSKREWWLVPPFFGQPTNAVDDGVLPACYWRMPTGLEITNFMHLALAHRCTGLLGWGTHSHQTIVKGMLFDGRTMRITYPETYEAMRSFGEVFTRIKPVLQGFTTQLLEIHRTRPFALDAQARWLKSGQIAVYAVNRDIENPAKADVMVMIGDRLKAKYNKDVVRPEVFASEIASVKDALSGREITWKIETLNNRFDYIRITDDMAPGEARLFVVSGKSERGFSDNAIPPEARKNFSSDQAYQNID